MKKSLSYKNILFYFQDQGSSNYLYHAIKNYKFKNFNVFIIFNFNVKNFFKNQKIIKNKDKILNSIYVKNKSQTYFTNIIKKQKINFVISTCSSNLIDKSNDNLFKACINEGLKINVFVDHWKGIQRFNMFKKKSIFFNIGVIDQDQKKIYSKKMPKSTIKITGNPVLQKIKTRKKINNNKILLVSEPVTQNNFSSCFTLKAKNTSIFLNLLNFIKSNFKDYLIYYRAHPKEKINSEVKSKCHIDKLNEAKSLKNFQIYIGFNSIFLYKAQLTGAKVIQLSKSFDKFNDYNFKKKYDFNKKIISRSAFSNSEDKCHKFLKENLV